MKILLIIIDGLGDRPIRALGNKTPLEAAKTPNLDWLVKNGICGQVLPFSEKGELPSRAERGGRRDEVSLPTSEDTHLALFGYNPKIYNPGRGVLEVLGLETKILPGDVCLRGNFATVTKNLKIIDRRAGRIEKTEELIRAISGIEIAGVKFLIKKAVSHRIGIVMRGKNLSPGITDGDPKKEGVKPKKISPKISHSFFKEKRAEFTADVLNKFLEKAQAILKNHPLNKKRKLPANYILVRGAGGIKKVKSFKEKYNLNSACIAGGSLYKGIAKFLAMDLIRVRGANALPSTNLRGKFLAAKKAIKKYNFIFCHIKGADSLAEDGNFKAKKEFIEKIDKNLKPVLNLKDVLIVVAADHSTCCDLKRHCSEPVPILIFGSKIKTDRVVDEAVVSSPPFARLRLARVVKEINLFSSPPFAGARVAKFSESACKKGKLGRIKQFNLMPEILLYTR